MSASGALLASLLSLAASQMTNSLERNGNWISSKTNLAKEVMLSRNFFRGSQTLFKNQLNLAVWAGYNEVILKEPIDLKEVSFRFLLTEGAYLYIILGKTDTGFFGVRLSSNPLYPSAVVKTSAEGKFLEMHKLENFSPSVQQWHLAMLNTDSASGQVSVSVDGKRVTVITDPAARTGYFGFRGSANNSHVDDVIIKTQQGKVTKENFSNHAWPRILGMAALATLLLSAIVLALPVAHKAFIVILIHMTISISLLVFILMNQLYFAGNYPDPFGVLSTLRNKQSNWVAEELIEVTQQLDQQFSARSDNSSTQKKVLFIGTSQTWGAGASQKNKTLVALAESYVNHPNVLGQTSEDAPAQPSRYTFINTSVSGARSELLLNAYKNHWIRSHPNVVVINLGHNDEWFDVDSEHYAKNLQSFVDINRENSIGTIFSIEANSPEKITAANSLHETMRKVAKDNNVPIIDLHQYLLDRKDTGILWWDEIHMTDYGQELTGGLFAKAIKDYEESTKDN